VGVLAATAVPGQYRSRSGEVPLRAQGADGQGWIRRLITKITQQRAAFVRAAINRCSGLQVVTTVAIGLTSIALAVSACSGESGRGAGGLAGSSLRPDTYQQTVAYSRCMQSHGDPGFPDPVKGPGGAWLYLEDPQNRQDFSGPGFNAAQKACKKLQPSQSITPAERQAAISQLLKLARCMRAHGVPNFPDPSTAGGGVSIRIGGNGVDPSSPQFRSAVQSCQQYAPGPMKGGGHP
jgi:hypothetical protein